MEDVQQIPAARLVCIYRPSRLRISDISYDAADRITGYQHYDATTGAAQAALDQSFAYDELGRLTGITTASASWSIGYDANGNRTGLTLNGTTSAYTTASTSNRLTSTTNPARSFGYDNAGNTVSDTYSATYNLAGRLATLLKAGTTSTYSVDGFGRRVRKFDNTGAASTVLFVYDQLGQLLGEYNSSGTAIREYVWLGNTPVAVFTPDPANAANPPLAYYIHTDHLATPRIVLDTAGQQRWSWLAEPFGTSAPNANPQSLGAFAFFLRHPGQYADAESGLFYNYFRDYDASTGRYAQSDPIGLGGGINTYAYALSSPALLADPDGLSPGATTIPRPLTLPNVPNPALILPLLLSGDTTNSDASRCTCKGQLVYRGDRASRPPSVVFATGFSPKGLNMDLLAHARGTPDSGYVATSKSIDIALAFAGKNGYVYQICISGGVDVNAVLGSKSPYPEQREIAVPGGIPGSRVMWGASNASGKIERNPSCGCGD
ncbi:RHS repeat-associated core domain-containing protein [Piscinibacter sp.]|uniref:RHS repeat-associated core domain-containing protein n=1 Tax=Piscinibacter sp. TaxID=1903157 RepID=UPI0039E707BB